jgi:hypothetical protein
MFGVVKMNSVISPMPEDRQDGKEDQGGTADPMKPGQNLPGDAWGVKVVEEHQDHPGGVTRHEWDGDRPVEHPLRFLEAKNLFGSR